MDITLVTRKTNTCCKKRNIKKRLKKIKSRREEEANGENILVRLEANNKEEIIRSTGHCTDLVLENKIIPNEGSSNTSRNSSLNFQKIT